MMLSFLVFCAILGPAFAIDSEYRKFFLKSLDKCNEKYKLDPEKILSMNLHQRPPQTMDEKCFVECVLMEIGAINEKGAITIEALEKASKNRYQGKDVDTALKILHECNAKLPKNPKECEVSDIVACLINGVIDAKLPPPNI